MTTRDYEELGEYTNTGELFVRERLAGPGTAALFSDGNPSGVLSGERWQLAIDITTGVVWQNTDGAKAWIEYLSNVVVNGLGFVFGTGIDGDAVFDGSATVLGIVPTSGVYRLARPYLFRNLSVSSGVVIACDGYPVAVSKTLSGSGFISNNGNDAIGAAAGLARAGTILTGGLAGGAGGLNATGGAAPGTVQGPSFYSTANAAGGAPTNGTPGQAGGTCHGGGGGMGGSGSAGGAGGTITMQTVPTRYDWMLTRSLLDGRYNTGAAYPGATGGGGGGAAASGGVNGQGGGGGGAAGWLSLAARYSTFTGIIEANGGAGAGTVQGKGAGGGGGGGGMVMGVIGGGVMPTFRALGGAGGVGVNLGGTTGTVGGNGGAGGAGFLNVVRLNEP